MEKMKVPDVLWDSEHSESARLDTILGHLADAWNTFSSFDGLQVDDVNTFKHCINECQQIISNYRNPPI